MMQRLRHLFALLTVTVITAFATPAASQSLAEIEGLLDAWQMERAEEAIDAFAQRRSGSPDVDYLRARLAFFEGRYEDAVKHLDQALTQRERDDWKALRQLVQDTHDVTKGHKVALSPRGFFEISYPPGKDEVLLPFAFEALDAAYDAFADELGYRPPTPIRVEVYDQPSVLAAVSVLTEDEIRTSGTIALCKYNRLMITSPKALLQGYGWVDTLVHEYVHYVINQATENRVPIWMHEGLAKFLERRWRGPDAHRLPPSSESLLQKRVRDDDLITFAQMHPSMAKLPSQEDAAVAFAEVYTAMEYLREQAGPTAFKELVERIRNGEEASEAFASVLGVSFRQFERDWRVALTKRPPIDYPDDSGYEEKLVFKDEGAQKVDLAQIPQPLARDHLNLGQMLQARGRAEAAVVQYRKAERLMESPHPVLMTRLGESLLAAGQPQAALDALLAGKETFPSYVSTWIQLGRAAYELQKYEQAREYLEEAARINPFDPEVQERLAMVYDKLNMPDRARRHRDYVSLVQ